ncbi:MAG: S9 family peptidase [Pyrinomonadaceae bacterium]|nr:S9 family peptidase [Pyrinomonadaceae bacterium]
MRTCRFLASLVVCLLLFAAVNAQSVWTPEMQVRLNVPGSPDVSPDGRWVVYTLNGPVMTADKSEFVTQIWIASADGKVSRQLTFADKSSTNPKFSPDGSMIAFTSTRKDNRNNIFILRLAGGEAEQITDLKSSVGVFDWSPDGTAIAYTMTDAKTDEEEKNDKGRNDFRWVEENTKLARLYLVPVAKDAGGKLEPRQLTKADRHISSFDWSPDGKRIVVSHLQSPVANYWPTADLAMVDVASGTLTPFAVTEAMEAAPMFSPDGQWVAATVSTLPVRWAQSERIAIYPSAGGTPRMMRDSYDSQPEPFGWSADGKTILFTEARGTATGLYLMDTASGNITMPHPARAVFTGVTINKDGVIAGVAQMADMAPEIYVGRLTDPMPVKVTSHNADRGSMQVAKTEVLKWKSKDGREIEGLLTYPAGYTAGTKVPLILNIHGGPAGVFQQSYIGGRGSYPLATLASKGYAILRPNPRGSSGYGTEFRRANIKDWAGGDYEDLMSGVDHVIAMGVADANRLGVMGWSYGGYMTSMIITKTNRFKAASAGAPVTNMMSFNGTADIPSFLPDYFESEFWEAPELYAKHSAMFNIKNAKTPTLVQHGENDLRVPIEQGYQLHNALRRLGVPTRMIVLPRQPHGIQEPRLQIATMQSNIDWFEKYLK